MDSRVVIVTGGGYGIGRGITRLFNRRGDAVAIAERDRARGETLLAEITQASFSAELLAGKAVIFLACAGSAYYDVYSKRLLERFSELEVLLYGYLVAIVCCAFSSVLLDAQPFYPAHYPLAAWGAVVVLISWMWVSQTPGVDPGVCVDIPAAGVRRAADCPHTEGEAQRSTPVRLSIGVRRHTSEYKTRRNAAEARNGS